MYKKNHNPTEKNQEKKENESEKTQFTAPAEEESAGISDFMNINFKTMPDDLLKQFCLAYEQYIDMFIVTTTIELFDNDMIDDRISGTINGVIMNAIIPILRMEEEMEGRGILKDYADNMSFFDYSEGKMYHYPAYMFRMQHLNEMCREGKLTRDTYSRYTVGELYEAHEDEEPDNSETDKK